MCKIEITIALCKGGMQGKADADPEKQSAQGTYSTITALLPVQWFHFKF
jgi:hypothetical protein